jgi:hypothetical protein
MSRESSSFPADSGNHIRITGSPLYHGTSRRNARKILSEGFRDWSWTAETPLLKYKAARGEVRCFHNGSYGRGTYVSCNWRAALHFGPVLFSVELQPGTRILRLDIPPEGKVLDSLVREFGREILTKSPWKVMPRNKRLTLDEAIQLARHHVSRWEGESWGDTRGALHEALMLDLRKILVRYGIQGWGEPSDLGGIVIFSSDRLKIREVMLSVPDEDLWYRYRHPGCPTTSHSSLDNFMNVCRTATNRGAANSRNWVEQANEVLRMKFHQSNTAGCHR